jgi:hypothetical protein
MTSKLGSAEELRAEEKKIGRDEEPKNPLPFFVPSYLPSFVLLYP